MCLILNSLISIEIKIIPQFNICDKDKGDDVYSNTIGTLHVV